MIRKYFDYIGWCKNEYPYSRGKYVNAAKIEMADRYLNYLEKLNQSQNEREKTIETKNAQIIGQMSIVISIISLFIPMFSQHFAEFNLWVQIYLILIFLILFLHFIMAFYHAVRLLTIDKNRYMYPSTSTITHEKRATTILKFTNEEITDLIRIINFNNSVINRTASYLIYAARCFKIGVFCFAILTVSILFSIVFQKKDIQHVYIENINHVRKDSLKSGQLNLEQAVKKMQFTLDSLQQKTTAQKKLIRPLTHPEKNKR